ncbi:MAG: hypothetical protein RR131_00065 [Anaerovorax sp.]
MLSTILLLYFFWSDTTLEDVSHYAKTPIKATAPIEVIVPDDIEISFGGGVYALLTTEKSDIWYAQDSALISMMGEFKRFSNTANLAVEEITKEQYDQVMSYRSIKANFSYSLDFEGLCEAYHVKWANSYDVVEFLNTLGYSEGSKESMFVYDGNHKKYYRIFSDNKNSSQLSQIISHVENDSYEVYVYYPMDAFLGNESQVLIPTALNMSLAKYPYRQELYVDETEKIQKAAQGFFGESLDFIRKITEGNGAITYMYGYGKKVLIANIDGTLEYKEEMRGESYVSQKQFEALQTALEYIAYHGQWPTSEGVEVRPYLKNVEPISNSDKETGYTFTFGMQLDGQSILYDQGEMISVTVLGGQVTYYKRDGVIISQGTNPSVERELLSPINMLAQSYEIIHEAALEQGIIPQGSEKQAYTFEDTAKTIEKVDTGYFVNRGNQQGAGKMKPAWIVTVGKKNLYFDLYTNEPLE